MRKINIRQLQRRLFQETKDLPLIVTRKRKPLLYVLPMNMPPVSVKLEITVKQAPPEEPKKKRFGFF